MPFSWVGCWQLHQWHGELHLHAVMTGGLAVSSITRQGRIIEISGYEQSLPIWPTAARLALTWTAQILEYQREYWLDHTDGLSPDSTGLAVAVFVGDLF